MAHRINKNIQIMHSYTFKEMMEVEQPADGEHAGAVAVKALVGPLAVILVRLKELVVEINVVCSALRKLSRCQQQLDEQLVQFLRVLKS